MARTTPELVGKLVEVDPDVDVTPFINTANMIVNDQCIYASVAGDPTVPYSDAKLEMLERWLAAHFYSIFDQRLTRAKAGTVGVFYQSKIDFCLKLTHYGQTAMYLDNKGNLAAWDNSIEEQRNVTVEALWCGRQPCEYYFDPFSGYVVG